MAMRRRRISSVAHRRGAIAFAAIGLLAPFIVGTVSSADAGAIAPTGLNVVAATANPNPDLGGAVPAVLVQAGGSFTLTISLSPSGASFNKDTEITLTLQSVAGGIPHGTFRPSTVTFPADMASASYAIAYSAADNGLVLKASANTPNGKITPGSTAPFDVVSTLLPLEKSDQPLTAGVGDSSCSQATTEPECGIIVLPKGMNSDAAFTLGRCTPDLGCTSGSQVIQFVADLGDKLTPPTYTATNPAMLIVRCDKQLCRDMNNGIRAFTLKVSQSPIGSLHESPPCAVKGVVNDRATFCTDYRQSHRDNSGDLLLTLLFTQDMRGST
jgi:hypothetical protein